MDKATADILAKVKKLMALGESPSEAEAASALEKARSLLARYGLSLADVDTQASGIVEDVLLEKRRLRKWEAQLIWVVTTTTFTQALHVQKGDTGRVLIIGREVNTASAAELFAYLHLVVLKVGRAYSAEVNHLESFKLGVVQRIGERLSAMGEEDSASRGVWAANTAENEPQGAGADRGDRGEGGGDGVPVSDRQLTVQMTRTTDKENKAYIADRYGKTKTKRTGRRVDAESYFRGREAGDRVSLNRQIR